MTTSKDSGDPRLDPHPRGATPGPLGERARLITAAESKLAIHILLEAFQATSSTVEADRLEWLTQTLLLNPTRGILAVAESNSGAKPEAIGVACVASRLSPHHGVSGHLNPFYIRDRAGARWFLGEVLELARTHGINHLELDSNSTSMDDPNELMLQRFTKVGASRFEIMLRPHFDDSEG